MHTVGLTSSEWRITVFLAALIIPFDLFRKAYIVGFVKKNIPLKLRNLIDNGIGSSKREMGYLADLRNDK